MPVSMSATNPKRFTASGVLGDAGQKLRLFSVVVHAPSTDGSVIIYDAQGESDPTTEIFQAAAKAGETVPPSQINVLLRNGGYVKIVGGAKAFCYVA